MVMQARRRGRAAARLHVQIVSLFSVIAVLPAVLVAVVANVTIDRGLDRLFSGPTRGVISEFTDYCARLYAGTRQAHSWRYHWEWPTTLPTRGHCLTRIADSFRELLTASAASRNLPGAMLIDNDRNVHGDSANWHSACLRSAAV